MARSKDGFLTRESKDPALAGEIWGLELETDDGNVLTYGIAGADGQAEKARKKAEEARVAEEAKRAAKDGERDAATKRAESAASSASASAKAADAAALAANSAAQSANANAAKANEQAAAAKSAAQQAGAAARLAKPYHIQQAEPPYAERVDGAMWVQTEGSAVKSINRWDAAQHGSALYPGASAHPSQSTYPAPKGAWSKFAV